jgi:hypothetical protein
MITVLMWRTSSQSEIDLLSAYHITGLRERSDSMIDDPLAAGPGHVASRRRGWFGVGRFLLVITRGALHVHFGPVACVQTGAAWVHWPDSIEPNPALDLGDKHQRTRGNIALSVLYLLLREVCAISRV